MTWIDGVIVLLLALFVLWGLARGFCRSLFSLIGLVLGLVLAFWNYPQIAALMQSVVRIRSLAAIIGFVLVAALVTTLFSLIGTLFAKAFEWMGLGWLDHIAGAGFGFLQGALFVVIGILVLVAFFPSMHDLTNAWLAKPFLNACRISTHLGPSGLEDHVKRGLQKFQNETPHWLHPSV